MTGRLLTAVGAIAFTASAPLAQPAGTPPSTPLPVFTEVVSASGITWKRSFGDGQLSNIVEGTGSGACVFDYDGDGRLDIYFPQGRWEKTVSDNRSRALIGQLSNALYAPDGPLHVRGRDEGRGRRRGGTSRSAVPRPTTTTTATKTSSSSPTRGRSCTATRATARSPT